MSLKYYFIQFWADWERNRLESENKNPFQDLKKQTTLLPAIVSKILTVISLVCRYQVKQISCSSMATVIELTTFIQQASH